MNLRKILIFLIFIFATLFLINNISAESIKVPQDFNDMMERNSIETKSLNGKDGTVKKIEALGVSTLKTFKTIIQGLLLLFMVYAGATMVMSMGTNEDELANSKRHIRYSIVALIFINIPGTIYETLIYKTEDITGDPGTFTDATFGFINSNNFTPFVENIIKFIQVIIFFVAILLLSISAIKLIMSRGREDIMKEHKNNIFYSLLGLVFVGLISVWKDLIFDGSKIFTKSKDFFKEMTDFVLMFAGPIAIFFLIMAGYYFITANGDDDKIKKGKSIIVNVVLGFIILLMSYTFLLDLKGFSLK